MNVRLGHDQITIGNLSIAFHRTLRLPDDGNDYPLPPSLGPFPICRVEDYADRVPASWPAHGGVFIPMYQREAAWLSFSGLDWRPTALKVAVGMVNAISGEPWREQIVPGEEQDYLVCPPQPWLDGIKAGVGIVRQFVAMPLGMGYTVEGQVSGEERFGGIQLVAFEPKPGRFAPTPPPARFRVATEGFAPLSAPMARGAQYEAPVQGAEMGIAAGGRMEQAIYPDPHGADTWDNSKTARVYVHIVNSVLYEQITGRKAPETPVTARTYAEHGLPWFDLYDEHLGDVAPSDTLAGVKSVKELDADKGFGPQQDDRPVSVPDEVVKKAHVPPPTRAKDVVADGDWSR
jgi:hypothetical protein